MKMQNKMSSCRRPVLKYTDLAGCCSRSVATNMGVDGLGCPLHAVAARALALWSQPSRGVGKLEPVLFTNSLSLNAQLSGMQEGW